MPDKKVKMGAKDAPPKPDKTAGHETADAAFNDIIDAILGADPEAVGEHKESQRQKRKGRA